MGVRLGGLLNWAILAAGVVGILWPAFIDEHLSLTQIIISLFDFNKPTLGFAMRWLSVVVVLSSIYILVTNRLYRNVPISVVWTNLHIHFESHDGSRVRFEREQALRANQPNVTACFTESRPTNPGGRITRADITASAYCGDREQSSRIDLHGNESRGFEISQVFGNELPYAWYMPLIPMRIISHEPQRLPKFLRNKIVVRHIRLAYLDEFNIEQPTMTFTASIYPQHNLMITIHCAPGQIIENLKAVRIKSQGVIDASFQNAVDGTKSLFVDRLQNEKLRISWSGPAQDVAANTH